jgi:hypothetical protein
MTSSDYDDACYEAWQRGIRAQCEQHGLIYEQDDFPEEYAEFDGFVYEYTKITDDDNTFIGQYEDRYGAFNPTNFEVDTALVAPSASSVTDIFTSHSNPITMAIAEHYHSLCLDDVHRQLKFAVRKRIQRMHNPELLSFFEWTADDGRIRVTSHQIILTLPDYDSPEDPQEDNELVIATALELEATTDPHMLILHFLLTADAVNQIPPHHLPSTIQINGSVNLSLSIPAALVTH